MNSTPQKRALDSYRRRLGERGMARFEVLGHDADRELIRSVARRLAQDGVLAALRRSPLVRADLAITREVTPGRDVDL